MLPLVRRSDLRRLTAVGQKQEVCSSIGLLARQSPLDRPRTTPSSATLSLATRQPNWSEADTLFCEFTIFSPVDESRIHGIGTNFGTPEPRSICK
jgi:hypothetical protein